MLYRTLIMATCVILSSIPASASLIECIRGFLRISSPPLVESSRRPLHLADPSAIEHQVLRELTLFPVEIEGGKSRPLLTLLTSRDRSSRETVALAAEFAADLLRLSAADASSIPATRENLRRILGLMYEADAARQSFRPFQAELLDLSAGLSGTILDLLQNFMTRLKGVPSSLRDSSAVTNSLSGDRFSKTIAIRLFEADLRILDALAAIPPAEMLEVSRELRALSRRMIEFPREPFPL